MRGSRRQGVLWGLGELFYVSSFSASPLLCYFNLALIHAHFLLSFPLHCYTRHFNMCMCTE